MHPVEPTGRILGHLWGKVAVGAYYVATALVDADVLELLADDERLSTFGELVSEVARVAAAEGACEAVDGFDPDAFLRAEAAGIRASWDAQRRYWRRLEARHTGVWRDLWLHRRPTEVSAILGPIAQGGAVCRALRPPGSNVSSQGSRPQKRAMRRRGTNRDSALRRPRLLRADVHDAGDRPARALPGLERRRGGAARRAGAAQGAPELGLPVAPGTDQVTTSATRSRGGPPVPRRAVARAGDAQLLLLQPLLYQAACGMGCRTSRTLRTRSAAEARVSQAVVPNASPSRRNPP